MKDGKTIKQIADEIGVSKQAVRKKITEEIANKFTNQIGNTIYISEQGEMLIKSAFSNRNANTVTDNKTVTIELITTLQEELKAKNSLINELTMQLKTEREHSREQADKIAILADQAQKLQLAQLSTSEQPLLEENKIVKKSFWDRFKRKIDENT